MPAKSLRSKATYEPAVVQARILGISLFFRAGRRRGRTVQTHRLENRIRQLLIESKGFLSVVAMNGVFCAEKGLSLDSHQLQLPLLTKGHEILLLPLHLTGLSVDLELCTIQ